MTSKTHPNANQEIASDFFQEKDEWFLSTLGALTAQWELAEFQLNELVCGITGFTHKHELRKILSEIRGAAQKVRFLNTLITLHIPDESPREEPVKIVKKYDGIRKRRNKYVHAMWKYDPNGMTSSPQTFTAVSRLQKHAVSRRHLRQLCEDIQDLISDIHLFYQNSGHRIQEE